MALAPFGAATMSNNYLLVEPELPDEPDVSEEPELEPELPELLESELLPPDELPEGELLPPEGE